MLGPDPTAGHLTDEAQEVPHGGADAGADVQLAGTSVRPATVATTSATSSVDVVAYDTPVPEDGHRLVMPRPMGAVATIPWPVGALSVAVRWRSAALTARTLWSSAIEVEVNSAVLFITPCDVTGRVT